MLSFRFLRRSSAATTATLLLGLTGARAAGPADEAPSWLRTTRP